MGLHAMYDNPPPPAVKRAVIFVEFVLDGVKDRYQTSREADVSKYVSELQQDGATNIRVLYRAAKQ